MEPPAAPTAPAPAEPRASLCTDLHPEAKRACEVFEEASREGVITLDRFNKTVLPRLSLELTESPGILKFFGEGCRSIGPDLREDLEKGSKPLDIGWPLVEQSLSQCDHYKNGMGLVGEGRYLEAAAEFDQAQKIESRPRNLHNIAQSYLLANRHDEAIRFFSKYLEAEQLAFNRSAVEKKIENLFRVKKLDSEGQEHFKAGRYQEAEVWFRAAYEVFKNPLYLIYRARALERRGEYPEAATLLQLALGRLPAKSPLRGKTQKRIADLKDPRKILESAIGHYKSKRYEEALQLFQRLYAEGDRSPALLYNMGIVHRRLGHREMAIDFFNLYLQAAPNSPRKAEVAESIAKLKASIKRSKTDIATVQSLIAAAESTGPEHGDLPLREARKILAGWDPYKNDIPSYNDLMVKVLFGLQDYASLVPLLEWIASEHPQELGWTLKLILVYRLSGEWHAAHMAGKKALEEEPFKSDPRYPELHYELGLALVSLSVGGSFRDKQTRRDKEEAIRALTLYLRDENRPEEASKKQEAQERIGTLLKEITAGIDAINKSKPAEVLSDYMESHRKSSLEAIISKLEKGGVVLPTEVTMTLKVDRDGNVEEVSFNRSFDPQGEERLRNLVKECQLPRGRGGKSYKIIYPFRFH